jgi:hypothetical protein
MEGPEVIDPLASAKGIATAFTLQLPLPNGGSIVLQTYLDRDADVSVYHETADKLYRVYERQSWKSELIDINTALAADEVMEKGLLEDFERIEGDHAALWKQRGKKGDPVLGQKEEAARENVKTNVKRVRAEIEKKKAAIIELEAKIATG